MYQSRQAASTKLPIHRKGTKYVASALSDRKNSVPVVIAVRDMLKLSRTKKEVKKMIQSKLFKINGKLVKDYRDSIKIFNLFEAGKVYVLSLLPTGKFVFEEASNSKTRLCKVINKKLIKNSQVQLNLHDGTNILTKEKIKVGDSVYLDLEGKMGKHVPLEKGKDAFIISGKYLGLSGKISSVKENKVLVKLKEKEVELPSGNVVAK